MRACRGIILLALALLALLCLPVTAGAATYIDSGFSFYIALGDSFVPDYPDLAPLIGEGLTKDDFIVSYSTTEGLDQSYYYFNDEGLVTISSSHSAPTTIKFYLTYTPKVQGVGKKTVFTAKMYVRKPLTSINVITPSVTMATDETAVARFSRPKDSPEEFKIVSYDDSIIDADLEQESWNALYYSINISPKAVGETSIVVEAYNGKTISIPVTVKVPPTELTFAKDEFVTTVGETIDLGLSYGEGGMFQDPQVGIRDQYNNSLTVKDYFKNTATKDWSKFYAKGTGTFTISMATYNGHSDKVTVRVYSKQNAVRMRTQQTVVNVGVGSSIYAYDENDKAVYLPMQITKGSHLATLNDANFLNAKGAGTVVITATNPDGSTIDLEVEIFDLPTEMSFNVDKLVMEVGDTFDLDIVYDKGYAVYSWQSTYYKWYELPSYMYPVKISEDLVVTAQAPGTMSIYAYANGNSLNTEIYITVVDNEKALKFIRPSGYFGVGETFQLVVVDGYGKIYPATYKNDTRGYTHITTTSDGLITANTVGENWIHATLADGRELRITLEAVRIPTWLQHDDMTVNIDDNRVHIGYAKSNWGSVEPRHLNVVVEDGTIARYSDGYFNLLKEGITKVTVTSIYDESISASFHLEVLPEETLVIDSATMDVPYGFTAYLPEVKESNGKVVKITWAITYDAPGEGNPNPSGFTLGDGVITCNWPTASCILTGTSKSGLTVKVFVNGYKLPETLSITPNQIWLEPGETQKVEVSTTEADTKIKTVYWKAETEGIVSLTAIRENTTNVITGVAEGETLVAAMLDNSAYALCLVTVYDPDARLPGDANEDGKVDINDALLVLQYDAGWNVYLNGYAADVNADGRVDTQDGMLLLQYSAGMNVQLKQYIPGS